MAEDVFRGAVWARPGARRTAVGGSHGDPPALVVRVTARAVDGAANAAVVAALAEALDLGRSQVRLVAGHRSRAKRIEVLDPPAGLTERWGSLLET